MMKPVQAVALSVVTLVAAMMMPVAGAAKSASPFGLHHELGRARPATRQTIKVTPRGSKATSASQRAVPAAPVVATPTTPFTECPAVGRDTSCGILIDLTDSGTMVYGDPSQGPYDGVEDTLIGVRNDSSRTVTQLALSSNTDLFGFDSDGICTYGLAGCPFGPTGYEGPGTSFSDISGGSQGGIVHFTGGLAPGEHRYFSLEESLSASTVIAGGPGPSEQGGPRNLSEHPTTCSAGRPVNCATGTFWHTFTDLSVPGHGVPLDFERTYSAAQAGSDGPLGFGWTDSYNMQLTIGPTGATVQQENGSAVTFASSGGVFTAPPRVLASLAAKGDGTYIFTRFASQIRYVFSSSGALIHEIDRNGYSTDFAYSGGNLDSVTEPSGRKLSFAYSGTHVTAVTDPAGKSTTFQYDSDGNLAHATDELGRVWSFSYDAGHLLTSMTNPRGGVTTNIYDSSSRVIKQVDPQGRATTWSYSGDSTSQAAATNTVTDARGHVTEYRYTNLELESVTRGVGTSAEAQTQYEYNAATLGHSKITDPDGGVTTNSFDSRGNLLTTTDPLGHRTTYSYDGQNDVTSTTDPLGTTTTTVYDGAGNLTSSSTPLIGSGQSATTTYSYAAQPGDITSLTDPTGKTTTFVYDTAGNRTSSTDPTGAKTTATFDVMGRRTTMTTPSGNTSGGDPAAHTTRYTYDNAGELISQTDPLGHETTHAYDANGNRVATTDANHHTTHSTFDADDELVKTARADDTELTSTYDDAGNLTTQTDAVGHDTSYAYDPLDRVTSLTDPNGKTTSYSFDASGNRRTTVDADGQTTTYSYDGDNRLTGISYSDGTTHVTESFDANGHRVAMHDGTGDSTFGFDSLGRMTQSQDGAGKTVDYRYDLAGRLISLTYPNGKTVDRSYDDAGRLTGVTDWLGNTSHFGSDPDSNLTVETLGNGVHVALDYNRADQLTSIVDTMGSSTLSRFDYTRDPVGQVATASTHNGDAYNNTFARDPLDQLTSDGGATYDYDHANNPTGFSSYQQHFDPANELLSRTTGPGVVTPPPPITTPTQPGTPSVPTKPGVPPAPVTASSDTGVTVDTTTSSTGSGDTLVSRKVSTRATNELLVVFVSVGSSSKQGQGVRSMQGGGLAWTRVGRVAGPNGTAEAWQARASRKLSAQQISARLKQKGYGGVISVTAFAGKTPSVVSHISRRGRTRSSAAVSVRLPVGAVVWGVGHDPRSAERRGALSGQAVVAQARSNTRHAASWVQRTKKPAATTGRIMFGTRQKSSQWGLVAVVIGVRGASPRHAATRAAQERSQESSRSASPRQAAAAGITQSFGYNARGDRTSVATSGQPTLTLRYDQADRLTAVGANITYAYDGESLRSSKTVNGSTSAFVWDRSADIPALLQDGGTDYVYGAGGLPIEQITANTAEYLHHDQQGSTRTITDAAGAVIGRYDYDSWGNVARHSGSATTVLEFDGQYTDSETGYQYLVMRYYDPASGQMLTRDPVSPLTASRYGYSANNPVDLEDPTGLAWYNPLDWAKSAWRGGNSATNAVISFGKTHVIGWCVSATAGVIVGGIATDCVVANLNGIGVTGTLGGGALVPGGFGASTGPLFSNAHSYQDLGGPFWYGGGSVGEGPVFNGEGGYGTDSCNRPVWYGYAGVGVGVNVPTPLPVSAVGGRSYTGTLGWNWGKD